MDNTKLLAILQKNINNYWWALELSEFDQLLIELENGGLTTTAERHSLLLQLGRKKLGEGSGGDDNTPPSSE